MTVPRAQRARAQRPGAPRTQATPAPESKLSAAVRRIRSALDARPLIDYTMIRSIVLFLAGLGVVMVMSSSMATSFAASASVWALSLIHI